MQTYAGLDIEWMARIYELQQVRLAEGEGNQRIIERENAVCRALYRMETRGLQFDRAACLRASEKIDEQMALLAKSLPFKTTPAGAKRYYFETLKLEPMKHTEKGAVSMDVEVRQALAAQDAPHAKQYDEWCALETANSMWYKAWPEYCGDDGRLRTVYKQAGVVSGRFSVQRVQLQAIPHDYRLPKGVPTIRSFIGPKPGHRLFDVDLSQAEVRVATWLAEVQAGLAETPMLDILNSGEDVHGATTKLVFPSVDEQSDNWAEMRQIGKRLTLGCMLYGAGAGVLREQVWQFAQVAISDADSERFIKQYRKAFPAFTAASHEAMRFATEWAFVRTVAGTIRAWDTQDGGADSYGYGKGINYHKAFNQIIQGSVADAMKVWMLEVEAKYPGALLLQVHDDLILELEHEEQAADIARMGEAICARMFVGVPFVADLKEWK